MKGQARELAHALDEHLSAEGFRRKGLTWNRSSKSLVDVIDLQVTKAGDAVYVNLGVADPSLFLALWERPLPAFVLEPDATVRTRLGPLFGEVDVSWKLDDIRSSTEIAIRLNSHGLPFLAAMREPGRRAAFLRDRSGLLPIEQLNVALVLHAAGDSDGACRILRRFGGDGPRQPLITRLMNEVGCSGEGPARL